MDGLWWLLLLIGPLLFLQRRLQFETQALLLLVTRRPEIALALFSLLFFPGVLLHESSHYLAARMLGVTTGRFSLLPRTQPSGRVQLGYVETAPTDMVRDSLIGIAPLLAGGFFVTYAGLVRLGLPGLWDVLWGGDPSAILNALAKLPEHPDFWLWFYLTFAVSSTMLPSASDRRAWLPLLLFLGLVLAVGLLVGAGPWLLSNVAPAINRVGRSLAIVLGITIVIHLSLLPPAWTMRRVLSRLTGLRVR